MIVKSVNDSVMCMCFVVVVCDAVVVLLVMENCPCNIVVFSVLQYVSNYLLITMLSRCD